MSTIVKDLTESWAFTQLTGQEKNTPDNKGTDKDEWLTIDRIPTGVHEQLLKHSRIPDPFIGKLSFSFLAHWPQSNRALDHSFLTCMPSALRAPLPPNWPGDASPGLMGQG
jgi:hypothetical protein